MRIKPGKPPWMKPIRASKALSDALLKSCERMKAAIVELKKSPDSILANHVSECYRNAVQEAEFLIRHLERGKINGKDSEQPIA